MDTGYFNDSHKKFFNAIDGAYTQMTEPEVIKRTFNVKKEIRELAIRYEIPSAIDRKIETCKFNVSDKISSIAINSITLQFRYSKGEDSNEMSVYFSLKAGIPANILSVNNYWFIYFKDGDDTPWLGIMTSEEWVHIYSSMRIIYKKVLTKEEKYENYESERELFESIDALSSYSVLDTFDPDKSPEKHKKRSLTTKRQFKRDHWQSLYALERAGHKCEIDNNHESFERKSNGTIYMEPHHLIPLEYCDDERLKVSIDFWPNIVSLCSNCHNRLHYGKNIKNDVEKLYNERKALLRERGLDITLEQLFEYYK